MEKTISDIENIEILYNMDDKIDIDIEEFLKKYSVDDEKSYYIYKIVSWLGKILQEEDLDFFAALSTAVYTGSAAGNNYKEERYDQIESKLEDTLDVLSEFYLTQSELDKKEREEIAWDYAFTILEVFCQIMNESGLENIGEILWDQNIFNLEKEQRRNYLYTCWRMRSKTKKHEVFLRKLAVQFFMEFLGDLDKKSVDSLFINNFCNYMIIIECLPLTWKNEHRENLSEYFKRIAKIGQVFERDDAIDKWIMPVINEYIHPDILAYSMAFAVLF